MRKDLEGLLILLWLRLLAEEWGDYFNSRWLNLPETPSVCFFDPPACFFNCYGQSSFLLSSGE